MQQAVEQRTPVHLWIVGALATLWNGFGAYDYWMTRARNTDYLESMLPGVDPQAMLAWIDAFPIYAQAGWGLGVWSGLLGSLLLLARSRYAVYVLGASLLGAVVSLGHQLLLAPEMPGAESIGAMATIMPLVLIAVAALLFYYAQRQRAKGVLR